MTEPKPKNYRNGEGDVSPPIEHADYRPCITVLRIGQHGFLIDEGPRMVHIRIMTDGGINADG